MGTKINMWFDDDYCLCGNPEKCQHKGECIRAVRKTGIHTYSLFYDENKECEYFIKKEVKNNDKS